MRLLLIHQAFVSPDEAGGTRHYEFARRLVQNGHQFTIVASTLSYLTGNKTVNSQGLVSEQMIDGICVLRAYTYPALHRSFFWRVVSFLSFMITSVWAGFRSGPVDVVIGTSPPIFQAVSAWFIAFLRRRPFLLEIRDLWPEFAIDLGVLTNPLLIAMSRWLEKFLYKRATHLLVNSPAYRDYLLNKGVPATKISLIPNGVDPNMFDPDERGTAVRQEYQLQDKFVAIYAGALGIANDIGVILQAAKIVKEKEPAIHIMLVGDGKERANLEKLASELNLTNVTFVGSRPKIEMKKFLAAADAGLATLQNIPMFRTTYPNKVFDYMAAGRPVILGIDGVIRDVLEKAKAGIFVPPGDAVALANALLKLCNQPELGRNMGQSGRDYVIKHFDRNDHANTFVQLVQELVN